ncbi:hypothetical protein BDZ85DRAFT_262204 [Elsinoe ampelina]|uniref:Short-chain dehydrogenase n=1 Tax=Elsinoe ampelina TaxID=302913 RepID=A0A6A6GDT3_9PEZI|nr:hypothetical protein BDZ85DRAFT_262204 [Elsinoe ampelina]
MTSFSWPKDKPVYQNGWMKMRREAKHPPKDPDCSFKGKTVVVTGANAGLGLEAAIKYAEKGCSKLILGVRSQEKGEATKKTILSRLPSYPADAISIEIADYSSFASITSLAHSLATSHPEIDILASNAGLVAPTFSRTSDGHETALQVNYLSHMLLAILLLPTLISTGKTRDSPSRIVFTSSMAHLAVKPAHIPAAVPSKLSLREALEDPANHTKLFHYGMTKMLLQTGIQNLTNALDAVPHAPIILGCCPAAVHTGIWNDKGALGALLKGAIWVVARTPEEGARTLVSAATLGEEARGGFWKNDLLNEEVPNLERGVFEAISKRDWEDVVGLLEGVEPEVGRILGGLRG